MGDIRALIVLAREMISDGGNIADAQHQDDKGNHTYLHGGADTGAGMPQRTVPCQQW